MERINYKINGLNVIVMKTDKFKTTDIIFNFRNYLQEEQVTKKALIPYILKSATTSYPSKSLISKQLEKLYGASLGVNINKQGLLQIMSIRLSLVNDAYLMENQTLLDDAFKFMHEIIFKPKLEDGAFSEKIVNDEKRLLRDHFKSRYNNKVKYAYDRLIEEMFKEEVYRIKAIGSIDDIDNINPQNCFEAYQQMINEDTVDMMVIGDIDNDRVKSLIETYFKFEERDEVSKVVDLQDKDIREVNKVIEEQEVNQAKLNIGLRTYTRGTDDDYYALVLMNAMFGLYPHSLLFRNVREKESLCYYISSNIDKAKGIMVIYAGIDQNDFDKVIDIINKQLEDIKDGKFSDELMQYSKVALVNDLLESADNPVAVLASEYAHLLYNEVFDVEKIINKLNAVTKDEVMNVAKKIVQDTIYLMKGKEV